MTKRKKIILGSFLGILIGSLLSVSYAMYTYNNTGMNNKLIAGDIYMRYKETSAINLSGAMPSSTYPTEASGNYFEFQIVGKNTSSKDITYNVKLAYGDSIQGKDRINDSHLVFKLVEVVNNVEQTPALVNDQSYNTIPGATLYTATIPKNTNNETTRTFRVYARISEQVVIGNVNQDYTLEQWNNLFASVKINVDGGFTGGVTPIEPEEDILIPNATPASCFTTSENQDGTLTITGYDAETCGTDVVIPNIIDVNEYPPTGISNNKNNNTITTLPNKLETNSYNNLVRKTANKNWKRVTIIGERAFATNQSSPYLQYMQGNPITSVIIPNSVTTIEDYAFYNNLLTSVVIPDSVITIGFSAFNGDVWSYNGQFIGYSQIESLILGNHIESVGEYAFFAARLTTLTLPYSLVEVKEGAFESSNLETLIINSSSINDIVFEYSDGYISFTADQVIINNVENITKHVIIYEMNSLILGNNVTTIGDDAFANNSIANLVLNMNDLSGLNFNNAFYGTIIDTVAINNATIIPANTFSGANINYLIVGNSVTTIGSYALAISSDNQYIMLPSTITSIASDAFGSSSSYLVKFDKNCADIKAYQTYPFGNAPENIIGNGNMICETGEESSIEIGGE